MAKFKVIKTTKFKDSDNNDQTHYVVASRGTVFNLSSFSFEPDELEYDEKAKTLNVKTDIEAVKRPYVDMSTGETLNGLAILPTLDFAINTNR